MEWCWRDDEGVGGQEARLTSVPRLISSMGFFLWCKSSGADLASTSYSFRCFFPNRSFKFPFLNQQWFFNVFEHYLLVLFPWQRDTCFCGNPPLFLKWSALRYRLQLLLPQLPVQSVAWLNSPPWWHLWSPNSLQRPVLFSFAFLDLNWNCSLWLILIFNSWVILQLFGGHSLCVTTLSHTHVRLNLEILWCTLKCPCLIPSSCQYQWSILICHHDDGCSFTSRHGSPSLPVFTCLPWLAYSPCSCLSKPSGRWSCLQVGGPM